MSSNSPTSYQEYQQQQQEKQDYEDFLNGRNKHYVDLYVQLKRNIEVKANILEQEQTVCELGFNNFSKSNAQEKEKEQQQHLNSSSTNNNITSDLSSKLKEAFAICASAHLTLLSQNFPISGEYVYDERKKKKENQKAHNYNHHHQLEEKLTENEKHQQKKYQERKSQVEEELKSSRKEVEECEMNILEYLRLHNKNNKGEGEGDFDDDEFQELIKKRFLRVNKMLTDVTGKFLQDM